MRHLLKHHLKRHKHHFGLWVLSGALLIASTWWLGHLSLPPALNQGKDVLLQKVFSASTSTSSGISASFQSRSAPEAVALTNVGEEPEASGGEIPLSSPALIASSSAPKGAANQSLVKVTFEFVASAGATSTLAARVPENASVYDAMRVLAASAPVQFEFKEYTGLGAMLTAINGVANNARAQKFWIYYLNGKPAPVGISSLRVAPGDVITWKYENAKF